MPQLNLSKWAIRNRAIVLYLLPTLPISGALAYPELPQNEDPGFSCKEKTCAARWWGSSSANDVSGAGTLQSDVAFISGD